MSETAQTLIKAALRAIGVIASGETPTADELADGLEALKLMLRHWSDKKIRVFYYEEDSFTPNGSQYYTIGSGGTINTARPDSIEQAYTKDSLGNETNINFTYNPSYPLGKVYPDTDITDTIYLQSYKQLAEPTVITDATTFPAGYDEAIKWNLALRLAPEFGKEPSSLVGSFAISSLNDIETKNFNNQINPVNLTITKASGGYNITNDI